MKRILSRLSSPIVAALLIFVLGSAVTFLSWRSSVDQSEQSNSTTIKAGTLDFAKRFEGRLVAYSDVLTNITVEAAKNGMTRESFNQSIDSLDVKNSYPSLDSFGYVQIVKPNQVSALKQKLIAEGRPSFDILPSGNRDEYTPLIYAKSLYNPDNAEQLVGYDLSVDESFDQLLEAIRQTQEVRASGPLSITDPNGQIQSGVALLAPVISTVDGENEVTGFMYATVRIESLSDLLKPNDVLQVAISIYSGDRPSENSVIYGEYNEPDSQSNMTKQVSVAGRTFTVQGSSTVPSQDKSDSAQQWLILALGIITSALLALFLLYVIRNKELEIDLRKTIDVQKAKENLLSLASHQLRTPATGVKQYLGLVLDGYAGTITMEQREMLEKANESNERQLSIVNQILKISKLENKRISLILTLTDPVELTLDVISEQGALLENKKINVVSPPKPILVALDVTYFRMVIENLINNAAKYSHDGAQITVSFAVDDGNFLMRVQDTGIGIDASDFDTLFEAFTRIDNEFSFSVSGTGIGLYIEKMIVDLHEGTIDVESEVGVGTTFIVSIPILSELSEQENTQ